MQLLYKFILHWHCIASQLSFRTVTASAENVNGSVRVAWNTTAPPQCVISVRVEFKTTITG